MNRLLHALRFSLAGIFFRLVDSFTFYATPAQLVAPRADASGPAPAPSAVNPFTRAAKEHREPFWDNALTVASTSQQVSNIDVPAFGFMRHLVVLVTASGGTASGTSAVMQEDAPYNVLQDVQLADVNGAPIVGPMNGYDLLLANAYGGYVFQTAPTSQPSYTAPDTGGNFQFKLRIPVEVAQRDGLGSLPNTNSGSTYKLSYSVAPSATLFSTAPGGVQPSIRVRCWLEAWTQPPAFDFQGIPNATTPPAVGTTQFWSKSVHTISAGENRIRLPRMGNLLRTMIMSFRTTAPARSTSNFPDPFRIEWDSRIYDNVARILIHDQMNERTGITAPTGVFVYDWTHDLSLKSGNEYRDLYLPTTQGTKFELVGSFGAAGTLQILTNDVAPAAPITPATR